MGPNSVENVYWQDVRSTSQLSGSFTIEFNVSGQNGMEYIDLQKSYMYVRAKIMKTNGDSLFASLLCMGSEPLTM
jgi:hypothetical protein